MPQAHVTRPTVWAFAFTYAMLRVIDMFTPVKVETMSEEIGLDESIHGEHAHETLEVEEVFSSDHNHLEIHARVEKEVQEPVGSKH